MLCFSFIQVQLLFNLLDITEFLSHHPLKVLNLMKFERVKEELSFLKLVLTILSAFFGSLTGWISSNFTGVNDFLLMVILAIDIILLIAIIVASMCIINLLRKI